MERPVERPGARGQWARTRGASLFLFAREAPYHPTAVPLKIQPPFKTFDTRKVECGQTAASIPLVRAEGDLICRAVDKTCSSDVGREGTRQLKIINDF